MKRSLAAIINDLLRYEFQCRNDEQGDDNHVIEMPDQRDEIRDEVKRQEDISDSETKEDFGNLRGPFVFQDKLVHPEFIPQISPGRFQFFEHTAHLPIVSLKSGNGKTKLPAIW